MLIGMGRMSSPWSSGETHRRNREREIFEDVSIAIIKSGLFLAILSFASLCSFADVFVSSFCSFVRSSLFFLLLSSPIKSARERNKSCASRWRSMHRFLVLLRRSMPMQILVLFSYNSEHHACFQVEEPRNKHWKEELTKCVEYWPVHLRLHFVTSHSSSISIIRLTLTLLLLFSPNREQTKARSESSFFCFFSFSSCLSIEMNNEQPSKPEAEITR